MYPMFRLQELEAAYYQLQTTGLPSTIKNNEGGFYVVTTADLANLKADIVTLQNAAKISWT